MGLVVFDAVKHQQKVVFWSANSRASFALTYYSSFKPLFGVRCVCWDSVRFLAHHYSKEPKFLILNPKKIIPAKVHVRLEISSCNMFHRFSRPHGRLPCEFQLNRSSTAKLWSLFRESCRNTPKNSFFSKFFGSKRNYFPIKVVNFLTSAPFTIKLAAALEVWAQSELYSKFAKRFPGALSENIEKPVFSKYFGPKFNFFPVKRPILFFAHLLQSNGRLPWKFERNRSNTANLWRVVGKPHKTRFSDVFFGSKRVFFPLKLSFLLLTDLLQSIGQLSCEFEPNRSCTAKLGMVSVV